MTVINFKLVAPLISLINMNIIISLFASFAKVVMAGFVAIWDDVQDCIRRVNEYM